MVTLTFTLPATITAVQAHPYGTGYGNLVPVEFPLTAGAGTGSITPSSSGWCWVFREVGVDGNTRVCTVGADSNYAALTDVDPVTFTTVPPPMAPAWQAALSSAESGLASVTALAAGTASTLQTTTTTANAAVPRGEQVIDLRKAVNVVGNNIADDAAALNAAFALSAATGIRTVAHGTFRIMSTVTITETCDLTEATFNYGGTTGVAIQVGPTTGNIRHKTFRLPKVICVGNTVQGWSTVMGATGVRLQNAYACDYHVPLVYKFGTGLHCYAENTQGFTYNTIFPGELNTNYCNMLIVGADTGETSGWVSTNTVVGGRFMVGNEQAAASVPCHLKIPGDVYYICGAFTFIGTSFEHTDEVVHFFDIAGSLNHFQDCRYETQGGAHGYDTLWRSTSRNNSVRGGYLADIINHVSEPGAINYGGALPLYQYPTATFPSSIGQGGLAIDSTLQRPVVSFDGITNKVIALQDDGVRTGSGSPEGVVATDKGVYVRNDTFPRTNLAKYSLGDSSTQTYGWSGNSYGTITNPGGYLRLTLSTVSNPASLFWSNDSPTPPVTAGLQYAFQAQVRSTAPVQLQLNLQFYSAAGATVGSLVTGNPLTLTPNTWTDLAPIIAVAPATATKVIIHIWRAVSGDGSAVVGDTVDLRHVIYETFNPDRGIFPYFDGSNTNADGVTYAWTGTAQQSTSTRTFAGQPVAYVKTSGTDKTGWEPMALGNPPTPPNVQVFTANGTWSKPSNATTVEGILIGGGGAGGSGRRGDATSIRCGGGGGAGGGITRFSLPASALTDTVSVTLSGGSAGGVAQTLDDHNGNAGTAAPDTLFGGYARAAAGGAGAGGTATTGTGGTGYQLGGAGVAASTTGLVGGSSAVGGIIVTVGGPSGGGITGANVPSNGGAGYSNPNVAAASASNGGQVDSTLPVVAVDAPANVPLGGGSGGAGASSVTTAAQAGRSGGLYGGGGAGGGASLNGNNSGAGGNGGPGIAIITSW